MDERKNEGGKSRVIRRAIGFLIAALILFVTNCDSWMESDDFFGIVDEEVKYANAERISVFVRFANTKEGSTNIDGMSTQKVEIPFTVSAVTSDAYGFYKWAAFSTDDYSTGSQHGILFNDDDDYITSFLPKELPSSIVSFGDPYSAETTVTINSERNDVFIIPVVTERPVVAASLPAMGKSDVVRNMVLRISFSKKMNPNTLMTKNSDGKYVLSDNVDIFRTTGTFDNMTTISIKDIFSNVSLGTSQKTLSIPLKSGELMPANTQIRISINGDVADVYGYEMGATTTIAFTTGKEKDSKAPYIESMTSGYKDASSWGHSQVVYSDGNYYLAKSAETSSTNIDDYDGDLEDSSGSKILNHRTTGKVHIWCLAKDISESTTANPSEDDVYAIYVRHIHLLNADGTADTDAEYSEKTDFAYAPGGNDSEIGASGLEGYQFTYDLSDSSYPDGLYRLDIAAADLIGNDSFTESCVDAEERGNYYKSIYVIKDTQPPIIDTSKIIQSATDPEKAPYNWYNASTLKTVTYSLDENNPLLDAGHAKLAALPAAIKWYFKLTSDIKWASSVSTSDAGWTSTAETYTASSATATSDGEVPITVALMDDVGNKTEAQAINSIKYDNTIPVIGKISWSSETGTPGIATGSVLTEQTLNIPFTEERAGIRRLKIEVTKNGETTTDEPFSSEACTIEYGDKTLARGSDWTVSGTDKQTIVFSDDSIKTGTLKVTGLKINTAEEEGFFDIKATITDSALNSDETKSVDTVSISIDTTPPEIEKIEINDMRKQVSFADDSATYWLGKESHGGAAGGSPSLVEMDITITETNSGVQTITFSKDFSIQNVTKVSLNGTAISSSECTVDAENNSIKFKTSPAIGTPVVKGENSIVIHLTNLKAANYQSDDSLSANKNEIGISMTDFALNESPVKAEATFTDENGNAETTTEIYAYSKAMPLDKIAAINDRDDETATEGFTNERYVNMTIATYASATNGADGVEKITLTAGAVFVGSGDDATTVKIGTSADESTMTALEKDTDYSFETTNSGLDTITLKKALPLSRQYFVLLKNVYMPSAEEGTSTLKAVAYHTNGMSNTTEVSKSIVMDLTPPLWDGATADAQTAGTGLFVANYKSYASPASDAGKIYVYPHVTSDTESATGVVLDENEKNTDGSQIRYFYTNAKSSSDNYGAVLGIPGNDNISLYGGTNGDNVFYYYYKHTGSETETIDAKFVIENGEHPDEDANGKKTQTASKKDFSAWQWFDAGATYSVVIKDEAGNYSPAYTFVLVEDTAVVEKTTAGSEASDDGAVELESSFEYTDGTDGYQVVSYTDTANKIQYNQYPYHNESSDKTDKNVRTAIHLKFNDGSSYSYSEAKTSSSQSGLYAYMISGSSTASETASATGEEIEFGKWIPFRSGSESITVYPSLSNDGIFYLHLQDNTGNTYSFQIRSAENKAASIDEKWIRDGDGINDFFKSKKTADSSGTGTILESNQEGSYTGFITFTGDMTNVNTIMGTMNAVHSDDDKRVYYNENAKLKARIRMSHAAKVGGTAKIMSGTDKGDNPEYCYRAGIYAAESSELPTTKAGYADKRIEWTKFDNEYSSSSEDAYATVEIDYPKTEETAATDEKPYLFLVIEDYVGNFGIFQIENYDGSGNKIQKWLYDNEEPKIYLSGTETEPSTITSEEDMNKLISQTGKRVYVNEGTAYLSKAKTSIWDESAETQEKVHTVEMGENTFRSTYKTSETCGGMENSAYRPYFNIDVKDEADKIYAFCYTYGSEEAPDLKVAENISTDTIYNTTASSGKWYKGNGSDGTLGLLSALIDVESLGTASAKKIYLHVCDSVGNVKTMQMGGIEYQTTDENATPHEKAKETEARYVAMEGEYYFSQETDDNKTKLNIAGTGTMFENQEDLKIVIPKEWYKAYISDGTLLPTDGDAIYGYSRTEGDVSKVVETDVDDEGNPYLSIPYSDYSQCESEKTFKYYVYDRLGNYLEIECTALLDSTAPELYMDFSAYSSFTQGRIFDKQKEIYIDTSSSDTLYKEQKETAADGFTNYGLKFIEGGDGDGYAKNNPYWIFSNAHSSASTASGYIRGIFYAKDENGENKYGELSSLVIKRYKINNGVIAETTMDGGNYTSLTKDDLTLDAEGLCTLAETLPINLDDGGTEGRLTGKLYEISISDYASNTTKVYLAICNDRLYPAFSSKPATTGKIGTDGANYYYNAMDITFTAEDGGIGSKSYTLLGGSDGATSIKEAALEDGTEVKINTEDFADLSSDSLSVKFTDKLGNEGSSNIFVGETEVTKTWIRDRVNPTIESLSGGSNGTYKSGFRVTGYLTDSTLSYNETTWGKHTISYKDTAFEITPSGSDSTDSASGTSTIEGYFVSSSGNATSYDSLSSTVSVTPSDYIGSGTSGTAYIYAVDYAGNISEPKELTIKKNDNSSTITIDDSSYSSNYYKADGVNYFNADTTLKATIVDNNSAISEYGFVYSTVENPGDNDWKWKAISSTTISKGTSETISAKLSTYITDSPVYYLYLYVTNSSQDTLKALPDENTKWVKDIKAPEITATLSSGHMAKNYETVATGKTIDSGTSGYYTDGAGYTLALSISDSGCGLNSVDGAPGSGSSYTVTSTGGTITVTATDKIGNKGTFTLKVTQDTTAPVAGTYTGSGTTKYAYDSTVGTDYVTNVFESGYKLQIPVTEAGSAKVKYGYKVTDGTGSDPTAPDSWAGEATVSSGVSFTLPTITEAHRVIFFFLKDMAGNVSAPIKLGNPNATENVWWITHASSTPSPSFAGTTLTITTSVQNPISTIILDTEVGGASLSSISLNGSEYSATATLSADGKTITLDKARLATQIKFTITPLEDSTLTSLGISSATFNRKAVSSKNTAKSTSKGTRKVSAEEILAKRYRTSSAATKTTVAERQTFEKNAEADRSEQTVAETSGEWTAPDFSAFKSEIARNVANARQANANSAESKSSGQRGAKTEKNAKKTAEAANVGMKESQSEEINEAESAKNDMGENKTAEPKSAKEEGELTAVQVQILKIIAAMLIATVIVAGGAFAKRKLSKKEKRED